MLSDKFVLFMPQTNTPLPIYLGVHNTTHVHLPLTFKSIIPHNIMKYQTYFKRYSQFNLYVQDLGIMPYAFYNFNFFTIIHLAQHENQFKQLI